MWFWVCEIICLCVLSKKLKFYNQIISYDILQISKNLSLLTNAGYLSVVNFGKVEIQYIYVRTLLPNNYVLCQINRLGTLKIEGNIIYHWTQFYIVLICLFKNSTYSLCYSNKKILGVVYKLTIINIIRSYFCNKIY